jgi:hypothetical protein
MKNTRKVVFHIIIVCAQLFFFCMGKIGENGKIGEIGKGQGQAPILFT